MYKLSKYSKPLKITIIVLMSLLIAIPLSGIIVDLCDRMLHYNYFKPGANGEPSKFTIDQLIAWLFVAFTNWYALFSILYGTVFLSRLGYKNERSEFKKFFFNNIFLLLYSIVIILVFWPDVIKQIFVGTGFIYTNSAMKNVITVNIHFLTPAIALALYFIFLKYEEHDFMYFLKRISYFGLIVPVCYVLFAYIRLFIYVGYHGFDPNNQTIVWWNAYNMLNPYKNPVTAPIILFFAAVGIYGITVLISYTSVLMLKVMNKKQSEKVAKTTKTTK
ncbi:hypothetical protein SSYRP_v1c00880 [Spiroplasma syrphidicola EA-1]|uniref:Transmembrane protein n=1 Tax=Spiroplasma syrphidicola EA-1 TaxID=1276229 RepID=R4UCT6_9MOLU|nr:hypothetical protein [Spiroplasma syrphidicola]AGM25684.1 hypothetical protein SSYRP_v1c00880 [Spiroplasma syrphidicola EA-1]